MSTIAAVQSTERRAVTSVSDKSRIASLDGWRGIAIALVLFDHLQIALAHRFHYLRPWTQTGIHGVTIFFVLSGFLITSKLLGENRIDLKRFYIRRFFRLMPTAWSYLAVLILLTYITGVKFTSFPEISACFFFYRNFARPPGFGLAGHFWSLSLEEQFYLAWPCLLFLFEVRRCRWIATFAIGACTLYRIVFWSRYDRFASGETQVHADALLAGCLLAMILSDTTTRALFERWSKILVPPALAGLLFCMWRFHNLMPLSESIAIAILIGSCVLWPNSLGTRLLSFPALTWLGLISYSVYVWQELFMHLGRGQSQVIAICAALPLVVLASYYWIERPLTRYGAKITAS